MPKLRVDDAEEALPLRASTWSSSGTQAAPPEEVADAAILTWPWPRVDVETRTLSVGKQEPANVESLLPHVQFMCSSFAGSVLFLLCLWLYPSFPTAFRRRPGIVPLRVTWT